MSRTSLATFWTMAIVSGSRRSFGWALPVDRVLLAVLGGYAASAGLTMAAASVALPLAGMARSEGVVIASMLGFLIYLVLLIWGSGERRLWRLALGMGVATGGGLGLATLLGPAA